MLTVSNVVGRSGSSGTELNENRHATAVRFVRHCFSIVFASTEPFPTVIFGSCVTSVCCPDHHGAYIAPQKTTTVARSSQCIVAPQSLERDPSSRGRTAGKRSSKLVGRISLSLSLSHASEACCCAWLGPHRPPSGARCRVVALPCRVLNTYTRLDPVAFCSSYCTVPLRPSIIHTFEPRNCTRCAQRVEERTSLTPTCMGRS